MIDDPLRMIRGLRLMSELNFQLEDRTQHLISDNTHLLKQVASERIKAEIESLIQAPWADDVIPLIYKINLLAPWTTNLYNEEFDSLSLKNVSSFNPD